MLCNNVCTFMGAIYLLIWILGNPLSRKKTTSPNIQHPIGNYKRVPRLFQTMLNYLYIFFNFLVSYEGKLKTPIWHGVYPCSHILVKEECTHHNPVVQLFVHFACIICEYDHFIYKKIFYYFFHSNFFLPQT